ncbi:hypothetical protein B0T16DRAFT_411067 [Cercophora newfieldiana]|uniref:Uncharacterized protein n=1 Tax=Cercophora newfieldiana TaxID=92897 RepID=A0AA39YCC3_9PEZI|nr:hypothetical protein B0T16DRAFT_411067 [Cercophora newfieldiana]
MSLLIDPCKGDSLACLVRCCGSVSPSPTIHPHTHTGPISIIFKMRPKQMATVLSCASSVDAYALTIPPLTTISPTIRPRQATPTIFSTCGYVDGDPSKPRIAPQGFNCRVDTLNGLWGFCPTTVRAATDCGLGGFCFDAGPCSTGCGRASLRNNPKITTWTCPEADDLESHFCSTASLIFGPDQTYDYVDCARGPGKANYFFSPTAPATVTSTVKPQTLTSVTDRSSATSRATSTPAPTAAATTAYNGGDSGAIGSGQGKDIPAAGEVGRATINTGAIAGGTVGGLAVLLGFVLAMVYLLKTRQVQSEFAGGISAQGDTSRAGDLGEVEQKGELEASAGVPELPLYRPPYQEVHGPSELPSEHHHTS